MRGDEEGVRGEMGGEWERQCEMGNDGENDGAYIIERPERGRRGVDA